MTRRHWALLLLLSSLWGGAFLFLRIAVPSAGVALSTTARLGFAALLMAGIDGIKNKIDPGPASDKDLYDLPPEELAEIPTVCGSLREALEELEKDMDFLIQGDVFTRDQLESYIKLKWEEVYAYEHTPHPIEYAMYYSC